MTRPGPRPAHVTFRARPPSSRGPCRCSPLGVALSRPSLLGKMAALGCSAPGLWVRGSGQCLGSLFTLFSKPLCSAAAAASRPLDAQRLAEKLRAQKQQQKTKEPVSPEGLQLPRGSALTGVRAGGRRVLWRLSGKRRGLVGELGEGGGDRSAGCGIFLWAGSLAPADTSLKPCLDTSETDALPCSQITRGKRASSAEIQAFPSQILTQI